jgi:hypothetical protein
MAELEVLPLDLPGGGGFLWTSPTRNKEYDMYFQFYGGVDHS